MLLATMGAVFGFTGIIAGAFAAWVLRDSLSPDKLATLEMAIRFQMYHALALIGVTWLRERIGAAAIRAAGWCFVTGVFLFSGSRYVLLLTNDRWFTGLIPFGGFLLLAGWMLLFWGTLTTARREKGR